MSDYDSTRIAALVRCIRDCLDLNQKQISVCCGLKPAHFSKLLNGGIELDRGHVGLILQGLQNAIDSADRGLRDSVPEMIRNDYPEIKRLPDSVDVFRISLSAKPLEALPEHAGFGRFRVPFIPITRAIYHPPQIICILDESPVPLSDYFKKRLADFTTDCDRRRKRNEKAPYPGPMLGLVRFLTADRTPGTEMPILRLTLRKTNWYELAVTNLSLGDPERRRLVKSTNLIEKPVEGLANSSLVHVSAMTSDGYLVVGRRGEVDSEEAMYQATVGENLNPDKGDLLLDGHADYFHCAKRGIWEELGCSVAPNGLSFHTFGVNVSECQHVLLGCAKLVESRDEVAARFQARLSSDAPENRCIKFVRANIISVSKFLCREYKDFTTLGFAAALFSMIPPGDIVAHEQVRLLFARYA